jgi:uncharacterized membrane protein YqjE
MQGPHLRIPTCVNGIPQKGNHMFWTMTLLFLVLWGVGAVTSYTMGGFVHLLLVFALASILFRLVKTRRDFAWPPAAKDKEP